MFHLLKFQLTFLLVSNEKVLFSQSTKLLSLLLIEIFIWLKTFLFLWHKYFLNDFLNLITIFFDFFFQLFIYQILKIWNLFRDKVWIFETVQKNVHTLERDSSINWTIIRNVLVARKHKFLFFPFLQSKYVMRFLYVFDLLCYEIRNVCSPFIEFRKKIIFSLVLL